jgi:uncharacterized protein YbjQ (UPF0145 family)
VVISAENYNMGIAIDPALVMNNLKAKAVSLGANGLMNIRTDSMRTTADAIVVRK